MVFLSWQKVLKGQITRFEQMGLIETKFVDLLLNLFSFEKTC